MKIPNYTKDVNEKNKELFKAPVRMLVSGPSGSGKTNMISHLIREVMLPFDRIKIYMKHKGQRVFTDLQRIMKKVSKKYGYDLLEILEGSIIPDTSEYEEDPDFHELVIFDDLINSDSETLKKNNQSLYGR